MAEADFGFVLQTIKAKQRILTDVKQFRFDCQKFIISTVDHSVGIPDLLFLGETSWRHK